jgi:hypothetical protein
VLTARWSRQAGCKERININKSPYWTVGGCNVGNVPGMGGKLRPYVGPAPPYPTPGARDLLAGSAYPLDSCAAHAAAIAGEGITAPRQRTDSGHAAARCFADVCREHPGIEVAFLLR